MSSSQELMAGKKEKKEEEPKDDLSTKFLKTRTIIISDQVNQKLADKVIRSLLLMEEDDCGTEIKMIINSPGGEIYSGYAIFDMMQFISCPVTTIVSGFAASMGSILSLGASPGRRFATPNAKIMIHQPLLQGVQGQATDLEIHAKEIVKTKKHIAALYASQTGKTEKQILKDMDRDNWMTADEALKYGLLDKIITSRSDLPPMG